MLTPIPNYPGYLASRAGWVWCEKQSRFLTQYKHSEGYRLVSVHVNGQRKGVYVHRLIALAFIPNPLNLPQVNHKNGIKDDNRPENLEWATAAQNLKHARDTGLSPHNAETPLKIYNIRTRELRFFESTMAAARYTSEAQGSFSNALRLPNRRCVGDWLVARPGEAFRETSFPLICVETDERFCNSDELVAAGFDPGSATRASKSGKRAGNKLTGQKYHFRHEEIDVKKTFSLTVHNADDDTQQTLLDMLNMKLDSDFDLIFRSQRPDDLPLQSPIWRGVHSDPQLGD